MKKIVSILMASMVLLHSQAHADEIETAGDIVQLALPLTALVATYTLDDPEGRKQFLWSFGSTFAVTHILKRTVNKERPDGSNTLSFPSGHTSSAMSGAAFLQKRYGWDVGLPAYLAAGFVGYSRVHAQKHDWVDVSAGALLAIGMNEWFVSERLDLEVGLMPSQDGWHFKLALAF
ncbi:phosphatase PAP2 family protein [Reinekea marina]|uniref:Phosphatase PAP2 family protein n=1 Tax=Reinekea marina TaxID=1310421 RepID=A0ABV7WXR6_9GAMM|nr:phosphatase PAP2 family protein [Reinekea marina]MDN3647395.1 phosphatase PAP2 family protein [Reinekea marina]